MNEWQDYVLALGSLVFTIALIPSLTSDNKPAIITSLTTFTVLVIFGLTYLSLSLWFSSIAVFINGLAWLALAIQKHQQNTAKQ